MSKPVLHVQMLGGFSLQLGDETIGSIPSRPASLLAYLILHRDRSHTRDLPGRAVLVGTPRRQARRNLSQALWKINLAVKEV